MDYSAEWPKEFARESERLQALLGSELDCVHHIGSTSVPGLPAKNVIDLLPLVRRIERVDELTPSLEAAGYTAWGEYGLPRRRYFTRDKEGFRTHNVHIYQAGDPDVERHLAFCAYLRSHDGIRDEYAALKREVFARHASDIAAYNDGKNDWIKRVERTALEWHRQQGRQS